MYGKYSDCEGEMCHQFDNILNYSIPLLKRWKGLP